MKRVCHRFPLEEFFEENKVALHGLHLNLSIYIDEKDEKGILNVLKKEKKRLRIILIHMLKNEYNAHVYRKEPHDLTAMKFGSDGKNTRIYCREFRSIDGKKVIMVHLLLNKDFDNASNKKIRSKLKSISEYEYEFKEN